MEACVFLTITVRNGWARPLKGHLHGWFWIRAYWELHSCMPWIFLTLGLSDWHKIVLIVSQINYLLSSPPTLIVLFDNKIIKIDYLWQIAFCKIVLSNISGFSPDCYWSHQGVDSSPPFLGLSGVSFLHLYIECWRGYCVTSEHRG